MEPGRFPEEEREDPKLSTELPLLYREEILLQPPTHDQGLAYRQEKDDGQKGAEKNPPNGQLSPSGTLKR